jgi:mevalonate kinase
MFFPPITRFADLALQHAQVATEASINVMPPFSNTFIASAPAKTILLGEHAVVLGSHALATVLDRRTFALFAATTTGVVRLETPQLPACTSVEWRVAELATLFATRPPLPADFAAADAATRHAAADAVLAWLRGSGVAGVAGDGVGAGVALVFLLLLSAHVDDVAAAFSANAGLTVRIESQIPLGAGLGSSAAFAAALAAGAHRMRQLVSGDDAAAAEAEADTNNGSSIAHDSLASINAWAYEAERVTHGNPSGVDNTVVVYGGAVVYQKAAFVKRDDDDNASDGGGGGDKILFLPRFPPLRLLVTDTHVSRNTKALVAGVAALRAQLPKAVDSLIDATDALTLQMVRAVEKYDYNDDDNNNNNNTDADADGGDNKQLQTLAALCARLFTTAHHTLCALGVGHPSLDAVVAAGGGVTPKLASKLTGAGGGGCAITLVPPPCSGADAAAVDAAVAAFSAVVTAAGMTSFGSVIGQAGVRIETATTLAAAIAANGGVDADASS